MQRHRIETTIPMLGKKESLERWQKRNELEQLIADERSRLRFAGFGEAYDIETRIFFLTKQLNELYSN